MNTAKVIEIQNTSDRPIPPEKPISINRSLDKDGKFIWSYTYSTEPIELKEKPEIWIDEELPSDFAKRTGIARDENGEPIMFYGDPRLFSAKPTEEPKEETWRDRPPLL